MFDTISIPSGYMLRVTDEKVVNKERLHQYYYDKEKDKFYELYEFIYSEMNMVNRPILQFVEIKVKEGYEEAFKGLLSIQHGITAYTSHDENLRIISEIDSVTRKYDVSFVNSDQIPEIYLLDIFTYIEYGNNELIGSRRVIIRYTDSNGNYIYIINTIRVLGIQLKQQFKNTIDLMNQIKYFIEE